MPDVLVVIGVLAFFALGGAYIVACARILTRAGDIDEPVEVEDESSAVDAEPEAMAR